MILKHLLEDLARLTGIHPYAETNITGVFVQEQDVIFDTDQTEIESLKSDIEDNEKVIEDLEKEKEDLEDSIETMEAELTKFKDLINSYAVDPSLTVGDLVELNKTQEEQLLLYKKSTAQWRERDEENERLIEKLRKRKNKGTISRDIMSGNLICEYGGKKYVMEDIKP